MLIIPDGYTVQFELGGDTEEWVDVTFHGQADIYDAYVQLNDNQGLRRVAIDRLRLVKPCLETQPPVAPTTSEVYCPYNMFSGEAQLWEMGFTGRNRQKEKATAIREKYGISVHDALAAIRIGDEEHSAFITKAAVRYADSQ